MDIGFGCAWILLGVGCVFDLLNKRLPVLFIVCGGIAGGIIAFCEGMSCQEFLGAMLPGVIMVFVGFVSGEKVGYGDGMILMVLGLMEGGKMCVWDMGVGVLMAAVLGMGLLVFKKARSDARIPFVPFLLAAHTIQFWAGV
ncbi:MAG: hypothetical protein IJ282_03150 [Lachnospiraceae bacterium]|nr:hypothetical protein [Lachnospiraceae bacterium]